MEETIRIKDKRTGRFMVDNVVLNGYGKKLRATGIAFYVTLCRFANNTSQQSFPSITKIQNETAMDRKTIISCAKRCEKLKLIKRKVIPGRYTIYTLLEPLVEKPPYPKNTTTGGKNHRGGGESVENELREQTKRTNLENTPQSSLKEFLSLKEKDFKPLKEKFPDIDVEQEYELAKNWLEANGKKYKNYLAFFRNWLIKAKKGFYKPNTQTQKRTEIEIKLIEFLRNQTTFKNPEAFIDKIKRTYGEKYLPQLLNIEVDHWYKFLNFWTKSKV